jgi:hypothetical protein
MEIPHAAVAELADAPDLGSGVRKNVEVRVLSAAFTVFPFPPPALKTVSDCGIGQYVKSLNDSGTPIA